MPNLQNYIPSTKIGLFDASLDNSGRELNITMKLFFANRQQTQNFNLVEKKLPTIFKPWTNKFRFVDFQSKMSVKPVFNVQMVKQFTSAHYSVTLVDWEKSDNMRNNIDMDPDSIDSCYADPQHPEKRLADSQHHGDFIRRKPDEAPPDNLVTIGARFHTISGYSMSKKNMTVQVMTEDAVTGYTLPSLQKQVDKVDRELILKTMITETIGQCSCFTRYNDCVIVIIETGCVYTKNLAESVCETLEIGDCSNVRTTDAADTVTIRIATRKNEDNSSTQKIRALGTQVLKGIMSKQKSTRRFKARTAERNQKFFVAKWMTPKPTREAYSIEMFRRQWCHEFGHMLGLTDDYHNLHANSQKTYRKFGFSQQDMKTLKDTMTVNNFTAQDLAVFAQHRYLELCRVAKVGPPLLGRANISMMSNGNHVMPPHMVTLWECLCQLTNHQRWRIVPH